jgi:hypothetical protein
MLQTVTVSTVHQGPSRTARAPSMRAWPGALGALALALLSGCGGGAGSGSDSATPVEPPVVVVTKTTLGGTAATGQAMAHATVRVKCVAGNATATAALNGAYTAELANATLPCVVSATSSDSVTVLHSLVDPAGGNTQTIHINPLTELLVARLAATSAASFYSSFSATTAAAVTPAAIANATTHVVGMLRAGGVDFSAVGNPITAPLVAATAAAAGNAYDQALDALGAKLRTANTTLAQLAAQMAAQVAAAAPQANTSTFVGVPPALLLQPAAPSCAALRSGTYRLINPTQTNPNWAWSLVQINAVTGVMTFWDNSSSSLTASGNCHFSHNGGTTRMVVSQGGVLVWTSLHAGLNQQVLSIAFPEQPSVPADLAGTWNTLEFNNNQNPIPATPLWINDFTQAEFADDGRHLSLLQCVGLQACTTVAGPLGVLSISAQGGLDYTNADGTRARVFVYRPASGDPMAVLLQPNSFFAVGSLRTTAAAPALGLTWGVRGLGMNSGGAAPAVFTDLDYRVSAVDATNPSYTRQRVSDGLPEVFTLNKPRAGLLYRAASSTTLANGQTVNLIEQIVMPLAGTGVSVYGAVTTQATRNQGGFGFAVTRP